MVQVLLVRPVLGAQPRCVQHGPMRNRGGRPPNELFQIAAASRTACVGFSVLADESLNCSRACVCIT
eukprot:11780775-Alexandrium_andersonii.AAC.1